ncbi:MAG: phosphoribosylanthranilate isomerase, partial [Ruminiclostridium sp.]
MTKIKICGLFRECDADYVNEAMPDFAGLVFYDKSRRNVTDQTAALLRERISPEIRTVGVFVNEPVEHIAALYKSGIISIIQLHGTENEEYISRLKQLTNAEIWKAYKVSYEDDLTAARQSSADKIVLDNGYGTGKRFNWSLLGRGMSNMILAGGLDRKLKSTEKITSRVLKEVE